MPEVGWLPPPQLVRTAIERERRITILRIRRFMPALVVLLRNVEGDSYYEARNWRLKCQG